MNERKIADLTVEEFVEVLLKTDEREVLKQRIKEYDDKMKEAMSALNRSKELFSSFDVKTVSSPFTLKCTDDFDVWASGVREALQSGTVSEVVLCMATKT